MCLEYMKKSQQNLLADDIDSTPDSEQKKLERTRRRFWPGAFARLIWNFVEFNRDIWENYRVIQKLRPRHIASMKKIASWKTMAYNLGDRLR